MIPVNAPLVDGNEEKYLLEAVRAGWISSGGPFVKEFEERWADYCGRSFGIAVTSGTTALEITLEALDLPRGSQVILPSFTIISCAQAVTRAGCTPVVVDCDARTWCMDPDLARKAVTPQTSAIMPVHIYGHPVDMDPLMDLAKEYGLKIIEDAAQVHGGEYRGRKLGGFGEASCFSFYANKIITSGEGGMVLTDDPGLAQRLRSLRNLCFRQEKRFLHTEIGHNYRLTNLQAAVGLAQTERIEEFVAKKREIARLYHQGFQYLPLELPVEEEYAKNVYWMYGIVAAEESGQNAESLAQGLREKGIDTRPFFLGIHEQPVFKDMGLFKGLSLPQTERIHRQGLYLPSGLALTPEETDEVIQAVRSVF